MGEIKEHDLDYFLSNLKDMENQFTEENNKALLEKRAKKMLKELEESIKTWERPTVVKQLCSFYMDWFNAARDKILANELERRANEKVNGNKIDPSMIKEHIEKFKEMVVSFNELEQRSDAIVKYGNKNLKVLSTEQIRLLQDELRSIRNLENCIVGSNFYLNSKQEFMKLWESLSGENNKRFKGLEDLEKSMEKKGNLVDFEKDYLSQSMKYMLAGIDKLDIKHIIKNNYEINPEEFDEWDTYFDFYSRKIENEKTIESEGGEKGKGIVDRSNYEKIYNSVKSKLGTIKNKFKSYWKNKYKKSERPEEVDDGR